MGVEIVNNFCSSWIAEDIVNKYGPSLAESKKRQGFFEDVNSIKKLQDISLFKPEYYFNNYLGVSDNDQAYGAALVSHLVLKTKEYLESFYNKKISKHEAGLVRLTQGAKNDLHSDMYQIDEVPGWDEIDSRPMYETSALLYLSTHGVSFQGGSIYFPKQNLEIFPEVGSLVFFKGDLDHIHEVKRIISGNRYAIVMFFGY